MIFLGLKFWPKVIFFFGSMKDAGIFLDREEIQRDFLGYAKKSSDFFG